MRMYGSFRSLSHWTLGLAVAATGVLETVMGNGSGRDVVCEYSSLRVLYLTALSGNVDVVRIR
jgi:hypothetical protein